MKDIKRLVIWNVYFYVMASVWDNQMTFDKYLIDKLVDNVEIIPILVLISLIYIGANSVWKELKPVIDKLSTKKQDNKVDSDDKVRA